MNKLIVGQKLWLVWSQYDKRDDLGREVTVTKVGRKLATINGHFNGQCVYMDTLLTKSNYSPARCWLSREEFMAHRELARLRKKFCDVVDNDAEMFTAEQIKRAAEILGIELIGVDP